ncbi:lactate dehydrogenase [Synergistales bacterium]|nr:lactate dehydrogenase [Synergistales bacterium]
MSEMEKRFDAEKLKTFLRDIFQAAGLEYDYSAAVSDNLVEAELRGVYSHGVIQARNYADRLKNGSINPKPSIKILRETPGTLTVDGDFAPGAVSGTFAMNRCLAKAAETGIASVAVRNGTHFGMAAYYAMRALPRDMIGFAFCNSKPHVAVYGSIDGEIGTNPICAAVPAYGEYPVVFDGATSKTAYNKVLYAFKEGLKIENGLVFDEQGADTDDPAAALKGALLPFGGYKGSGLAVIVEIFCSLLTGTSVQLDADTGEPEETPDKVGFYFSAIDVAAFGEPVFFKKSVDMLIRRLKNLRRKDERAPIYMPGELEFRRHEEGSANGVKLGGAAAESLASLGEELKLPIGVEDLVKT